MGVAGLNYIWMKGIKLYLDEGDGLGQTGVGVVGVVMSRVDMLE